MVGCYCDEAMKVYLAGLHSRVYLRHHMKVHLAGVQFWGGKEGGPNTDHLNYRLPNTDAGESPPRLATLESFVYVKDWMLKHIREDWDFILDSGAFTFFGRDTNVNWREYVRSYTRFINENKVDKFFELDIETITDMATTEDLRKQIEDETGKQPIPVWRPLRGFDYWSRMIEEYPYVAISASGRYDSRWTRGPDGLRAINHLCQLAHKAGVKVHGLGYTKLESMPLVSFDSVDSTAWIFGNMTGKIYRFNGETMVKEAGEGRLRSKEAAVHNFLEWVKYQRYADANL